MGTPWNVTLTEEASRLRRPAVNPARDIDGLWVQSSVKKVALNIYLFKFSSELAVVHAIIVYGYLSPANVELSWTTRALGGVAPCDKLQFSRQLRANMGSN